MKKATLILGLMLVLVMLAACAAPTEAPKPTSVPAAAATTAPAATQAPAAVRNKGGTFIDASFAEAVSLQPLITNDTASSSYQSFIYAALTRSDPNTLEVLGNLYENNPTLSADGAKLIWKLKQGLKWSDGTPMTAKDVQFTWDKMMEEKTKFPAKKFYSDSFKSVKALDDFTIEYELTQPGFCPAIRNSAIPGPIPMHIFKDVDINQNPANDKPLAINGYWNLKDWKKDDNAQFAPSYPNFVRGEALLDGYTIRIVKDNTVALQMFKTQDIDIVTPDPIDWDEVKKLPFAATYEYYPAAPSWTYVGFNTVNPLLSDKKVRQAISHAINKQEFVDKIRLGYAKVQHSNIPATSWAFTDDVPKFNYDVAKAKALLKEAGWVAGSDGILAKDGKKFQIRLFYNAGNKQREMISIITQDYLKAVGIAAEVIPEEWTAYLKRVQEPDPKKRDFEMFVLGWSGGIDPFGTGNIWKSKGSQNYTGFNSAEIDKLYDDAAVVPGCKQDDRKKLYAKIQQIVAEEQPYLFLYTNQSLIGVNKRIKVNPATILGINYTLETWQLNK
ncbi:MAG: hypothetical protein HY868_10300 [Chloroflexi bacterium]|nr:hypothetical protein [Chloroflexota bacterium]